MPMQLRTRQKSTGEDTPNKVSKKGKGKEKGKEKEKEKEKAKAKKGNEPSQSGKGSSIASKVNQLIDSLDLSDLLDDKGKGLPTVKSFERIKRLLNGASDDSPDPSIDTDFDPLIFVVQDRRHISITNSNTNSAVGAIGSGNTVTGTSNTSTNFTNVNVSTLAFDGLGLTADASQTDFIYSTVKSRWEIVRYIAWKNIEVWCSYRFSDSTPGEATFLENCLTGLGLSVSDEENYLPCLDYLNLIDNTRPTAQLDLPVLLHDCGAMLRAWQTGLPQDWLDRARPYLQRRLLTYYYLQYRNSSTEGYTEPYYCIPCESMWRTIVGLCSIQDTFNTVFRPHHENGEPFTIVLYEDLVPQTGAQGVGGVDIPTPGGSSSNTYATPAVGSLTIMMNNRATQFPSYSFYGSQNRSCLQQIFTERHELKRSRNRKAHHTNGLEVKKYMDLFKSVPGLKKACGLDPIDEHILKSLDLNFKHFFGAGYGRLTDSDDILSKYVLPNVIKDEKENFESMPSS